jgi:hypothetical protein
LKQTQNPTTITKQKTKKGKKQKNVQRLPAPQIDCMEMPKY